MASRHTHEERALESLRSVLRKGNTVFVIARHVAASGMQRTLDLIVFHEGHPLYLGYNTAIALGLPYDEKHEGVKVRGAGMDMGFHLVSNLSYKLFGKEGALRHEWL